MPALASKTNFNYGGQGPLPGASLAAITEAFVTFQHLDPFTEAVWPTIIRTVAEMLDGGSAAATAVLECLVDSLPPPQPSGGALSLALEHLPGDADRRGGRQARQRQSVRHWLSQRCPPL